MFFLYFAQALILRKNYVFLDSNFKASYSKNIVYTSIHIVNATFLLDEVNLKILKNLVIANIVMHRIQVKEKQICCRYSKLFLLFQLLTEILKPITSVQLKYRFSKDSQTRITRTIKNHN